MKNTQPSRCASAPDLWRNAWVNGLAGLGLTLGLGMGLAGFLGLWEAYVPKALAVYGLILLVLLGFLPVRFAVPLWQFGSGSRWK